MYKRAQEEINKGLSPVARYILALFAGLFGVVMLLIAPPTDKAIFFYLFGVFCLLIAIASITKGRVRQFVGSLVGVALFILSLWYLYAEISGGVFISSRRSEPSVVHAVMFLILFGLPGIAYAIKVKFGAKHHP